MTKTITDTVEAAATVSEITRDTLGLGNFAIAMAGVERALLHPDGRHENDAEHSFELAFVAMQIAAKYYPELDIGLVAQYAIIHDALEKYTGDTPTWRISDEDLQAKYEREARAFTQLKADYAQRFPHLVQLVEDYEQQSSKEARFVRAMDKCLPAIMHLSTSQESLEKLKNTHGILTQEDLIRVYQKNKERFVSRFGDEFPQLVTIKSNLHQLALKRFFPDAA